MGSLAWLKLHNVHYSCVTVNDSWSPDEGLCTAVDGNKSQTDDMVNSAEIVWCCKFIKTLLWVP